ncbi:MAG TPA: hypothetical protein DDW24_10850 [Blastocatellia bacterium]|nr:hypothetical protein [Blastocatellia bacterium]
MMSSDLSSKFHQFSLNMREFSERRVYEFENFRLDADSLLLFRSGEPLPLTPKVVATLLALVERSGEIVSKDDLMKIVWPDTQVEEGNLTQNLYLLRKTLGASSDGPPFIETLRRRGYRFTAEVSYVAEQAAGSMNVSPVRIVERKENIYSVLDWQNHRNDNAAETTRIQPVADLPGPINFPVRRNLLYSAAIVLGVSLIVIVAFSLFKIPGGGTSQNAANELTFVQLTDGRDVNDATVSPDGRYLTYHEIDSGIFTMFVQQVGESNRIVVVPPTTRTIASKTFAPDGQSIYYIAGDPTTGTASLFRVPTLGGIETKLIENVGSTVAISQDGAQIAFIRDEKSAAASSVIIVDSNGENARTVFTGAEGSVIWGGLSWSPDGGSIAMGSVEIAAPTSARICSIQALNVFDGSIRQLSPEKWDTCGRMAWTAHGDGLFFIGTKGGEALSTRRDQLYYLSLESGEARRITTDGNRLQVSSLGLTSDDSVLIVPFNRSSQLWIMDANGSSDTAVQITRGLADGRAGIAPLPDGRIAYIARTGDFSHVWAVNPDGSDARQVTSEPDQIEELRASADGSRFYFSTQVDGTPSLFSCRVDGTELGKILDDPTFDVDSSYSPDGTLIAYNSTVGGGSGVKNSIRIAATDGSKVMQISESYAQSPHFSPDGKFISYAASDNTIAVMALKSGEVIGRFRTVPNASLNVGARWMPDGKAIAYISHQKSAGNIFVQPIDGSKPTRLTDFTSGEIHNFAFTADGRNIVVARGYPIRNAVLIKNQPR